MTDYAVHEPEFSGTVDEEWDAPQLEDFDSDDLAAVADHFVLSASGFPPDDFSDLKLPVVDPDGNLNRRALQAAKSGGRGIGAVEGIDEETAEEVEELLDRLTEENFES